jgi:hypothetical protein
MIADKRFFFFICFLLLLPFLGILIFYLANPFTNKCIQGNCENGKGVYISASGMKYEGEWKNGKRDGQGNLTYSNGSKYTGGWKNNRMHGQGIKIYASDHLYKKYIGEWINGNKHGKGTIIYSDGGQYAGDWRNGEINGQGTYTAINGRRLEGEWKDGTLHGQVTEYFPDGSILAVKYENGNRQGRGIMTYPDGTKTIGEWINSKLVGSAKFYLFHSFEFQKDYTIATLCSIIKRDIHLSTEAKENTIEWLNELLKIPDLSEKLNNMTHEKSLSKEIDTLLESTKDFRNKSFSELNLDKQKDILKLNRLLIEHLYPTQTPKS